MGRGKIKDLSQKSPRELRIREAVIGEVLSEPIVIPKV